MNLSQVAAQLADEPLFLGKDLLAWLVLAFGSAMVIGNLAAWIRPPVDDVDAGDDPGEGTVDGPVPGAVDRPPAGRTFMMVAIGAVAAIWALASLIVR